MVSAAHPAARILLATEPARPAIAVIVTVDGSHSAPRRRRSSYGGVEDPPAAVASGHSLLAGEWVVHLYEPAPGTEAD